MSSPTSSSSPPVVTAGAGDDGSVGVSGQRNLSGLAPSMPAEISAQRVLSIQSSVVFGYVGHKSSIFPLQLLGFDVDPIHTCQFSNHTGYPHFSGFKTSGENLNSVVSGMEKNNMFNSYSFLLLGYMSNSDFFKQLLPLIKRIKQENPKLFIVCDPVMGDNGKMYVPSDFVEIYRDIVPISSVVTPNQTEAELLTGQTIKSFADAFNVCKWFHQQGVPIVVLTSLYLEDEDTTTTSSANPDQKVIHVIASQAENYSLDDLSHTSTLSTPTSSTSPSSSSLTVPSQYLHMSFPQIPAYFSGTGDLTTALLLARLKLDKDLKTALEKTMATVQGVISRTHAAKSSELLLIQSKVDIEQPTIKIHANIRKA